MIFKHIYVDDDKDAKELLAQITNLLLTPKLKLATYGAISPVAASSYWLQEGSDFI
ncbi:hypothetical protein ACEW7V_01305 [Areca yellow leaf disease phytoplasma]|uniref:hypothetical protein n=1 Tax=Areca yellow leaf disease phytoplasma TaxID=927614 RepID=UPI0035B51167